MQTLGLAAFYHTSFTSWCLMQEILSKSQITPDHTQEVVFKAFQNVVASITLLATVNSTKSSKLLGATYAGTLLVIATPIVSPMIQSEPTISKRVKMIVLYIDKSLNILVKITNIATATLLAYVAFDRSASHLTGVFLSSLTKEALKTPTHHLQPQIIVRPNLVTANAPAA